MKPYKIKAKDIEPASKKMLKEREEFYEGLADKVANYLRKKEKK